MVIAAAFEDANVLKNDAVVNKDNFAYVYEFDNSIKAEQKGDLVDEKTWVVRGQYSYKSPEGEEVSVTYTADENGYHVDSAHPLLPTPPPIPDYILKSIDYIKAHPSHDA